MKKVLNRNLGLFDTVHVPEAFQPADPKIKKRWDESWREFQLAVIEKAGGPEKASGEAYVKAYQEVLNTRRATKMSSQRQEE